MAIIKTYFMCTKECTEELNCKQKQMIIYMILFLDSPLKTLWETKNMSLRKQLYN